MEEKLGFELGISQHRSKMIQTWGFREQTKGFHNPNTEILSANMGIQQEKDKNSMVQLRNLGFYLQNKAFNHIEPC